MIVTSGTAMVSPEDYPRASEQAADAILALGVRVAAIRLSPSVHGDEDKHGFIPILFNIARKKGFSAYIRVD